MVKLQNSLTNMLPHCTSLDNTRLWFFGLSGAHLIVTAAVTLSIDMRHDDDPNVRMYWHVRWLLLTCWVNMFTLFYLPVSFYCEWRQKYNKITRHVDILNNIRDITLTSVIFPLTLISDVCFWCLWNIDPTLIAPVRIFEYLPNWAQHSLHSISLVVVIFDLLLVPRRKPASLFPGFIMLTVFISSYYIAVTLATLMECYVYEFLKIINALHFFILALIVSALSIMIIHVEWVVIGLVWRPIKNNTKST